MLTRIGRYFDRGASFLVEMSGHLSATIVVLMSLIIAYDAIVRYLGHPTIWAGEVATYMLVWISFVGAAWGLEKGAQFRVDIFSSRWSAVRQKQVEIILLLLCLFFCFLLFKGCLNVTLRSLRFGGMSMTPLKAPLILPQAALPLGTFLLCIQLIKMIIHDALDLITIRKAGQRKMKQDEARETLE
jgi:TRAP-type C4-dicarboxylate transport system permease small subunit